MAGHSKWANIKHRKGLVDAKRGKIFTKLIREITVSARMGGGDPDGNPRLRQAIDKAKAASMPKDNMDRAIKKGTGEGDGQAYEDIAYEGYGPGGIAVLVSGTTDNKNRTVAEIRNIFSKHGGNMGEAGSVSWMFSRKGYIAVLKTAMAEDALMELALEAGAEDIKTDDEMIYEIITPPTAFFDVKGALEAKKITIEESDIANLPQTYMPLDAETEAKAMKLIELLEDHDDISAVDTNFMPSDDV